MTVEFRPRALLSHLTAHGVDFVVVGGIAAVLHGAERNTFDLDVCPAADQGNLDALARALTELSPLIRGVEEDVPFVPDGRSLRSLQILTLATSLGPLDVITSLEGWPPYASLRRRALRVDIGPTTILVASIDDLLEMKRASARDKDRFDVEALEAIKGLTRGQARSARRRREG